MPREFLFIRSMGGIRLQRTELNDDQTYSVTRMRYTLHGVSCPIQQSEMRIYFRLNSNMCMQQYEL